MTTQRSKENCRLGPPASKRSNSSFANENGGQSRENKRILEGFTNMKGVKVKKILLKFAEKCDDNEMDYVSHFRHLNSLHLARCDITGKEWPDISGISGIESLQLKIVTLSTRSIVLTQYSCSKIFMNWS